MARILVGGAGGAPSEGVINSLLRAGDDVVGMGSEPADLVLSAASRKYWSPYADQAEYADRLIKILEFERPDLVHFQHDLEVYSASLLRESIHGTGTRTMMPSHDVIDTCVHKFKTWQRFKSAGIPVPESRLIHDESDLRHSFVDLGDDRGAIWLRSSSIGGGGKGALPTSSYDLAKAWIDHYHGWGNFVAAELLTSRTVTWLSIWHEGELIVAQARLREGWTHGSRTLSGVTGVTKVGMTCRDPEVDAIAIGAIHAVDEAPNGIYGVDMTYDSSGVPNPTEINISRFFTTVLFFTEAGLNMPKIFVDIALYGKRPTLERKISPLPEGLMWVRAMDRAPMLTTAEQMRRAIEFGGSG